MLELSLFILPLAVGLDLIFGDPERLPHPIRWMGYAISAAEPRFRALPVSLTLAGGLMAVGLIVSTWLGAAAAVVLAGAIHPVFGVALQVVLIYYAISIRSLESAADEVFRALRGGDLPKARSKVAMIVGRNTESLSDRGVSRATVETVAENLVDGVVSPLFFAAIGGAPLALAYKMVNTLDSMIGYKNETYREFGRVAARIDDAANAIPARVCVPVIALAATVLARRGQPAFKTAIRDGRRHTSPNAGFPEAAFAGALGVWLGGPNRYGDRTVEKPVIGVGLGETRPDHIRRACDLMILSSAFWLLAVWPLAGVLR